MQNSTRISKPDSFITPVVLFWILGVISVITFCVAAYTEQRAVYLLPFGVALAALLALRVRWFFYLMLLALPLSVETYLGDFGTDLPSEPLVVMLAVAMLLRLVTEDAGVLKKMLRHPIVFLLLLQFGWSCWVTLFSTDVFVSVKYLLAKSWYLLGFFVAVVLLLRDERYIRTFFWCLFMPTFGSVVFILVKHATLDFEFDSIQKAVSPIYRNHVNYAVFITMLLPFIFLAKSWYPASSVRHKLLKFAIPVFLLAIYFSYTRGAWLATVGMLLYAVVLKRNWTKPVLLLGLAGVVLFAGYLWKDNHYLKFAPDFEHTIYHDDLSEHLSSTFEMKDMSTVERFYRWIAAVRLFEEHPWTGVGPNNFVSNYKAHAVTAYETYISDNEERSTVHNYMLLLLTEQGAPAAVMYVVLVVVVLLIVQNGYNAAQPKAAKLYMAIGACLVVFIFNNTLSDLVEANKVGSLYFMCLGMLVLLSTGLLRISEEENA